MTNYEYLQSICNRFPELIKLETEIVGNDINVRILNPKNEIIFAKEVTLKNYDCTPEEVEEIKNDMAYDIVCFLVLDTLKAISKAMDFSKQKKSEKLN